MSFKNIESKMKSFLLIFFSSSLEREFVSLERNRCDGIYQFEIMNSTDMFMEKCLTVQLASCDYKINPLSKYYTIQFVQNYSQTPIYKVFF